MKARVLDHDRDQRSWKFARRFKSTVVFLVAASLVSTVLALGYVFAFAH